MQTLYLSLLYTMYVDIDMIDMTKSTSSVHVKRLRGSMRVLQILNVCVTICMFMGACPPIVPVITMYHYLQTLVLGISLIY